MPAASKTAFDSPQLPSPNPITSACNQTASKQPVRYGKLTPQMQAKKHFPAGLHFGVTRSNYNSSNYFTQLLSISIYTSTHRNAADHGEAARAWEGRLAFFAWQRSAAAATTPTAAEAAQGSRARISHPLLTEGSRKGHSSGPKRKRDKGILQTGSEPPCQPKESKGISGF